MIFFIYSILKCYSFAGIENAIKQAIISSAGNGSFWVQAGKWMPSLLFAYFRMSASDKNATLVIRDLYGRALKQISLVAGKGSTAINAGELPAGTYTYSLMVTGECADTKLMVVVR